MSDRYEHPEDSSAALPPGLGEIDAYLERVGARWRDAPPGIDTIAGHLRDRAGQLTAEHTAHATMAEAAIAPGVRTVPAPIALHRDKRMRRRSLRFASGLVAALTMVAVVGALTTLLLSASPGRGPLQSHNTSTTGDGAPSQRGRWIPLDKLDAAVEFDANDLPAIAPSNPRVVYETMVYGTQQQQAGSLRRTDDGGATWHNLPLPIPAAHVGHAGILVSPLDPRNVFLTLISTNAADCPADRIQANSENGSAFCWIQYTSTDSGALWAATNLPTVSVLTPNLTNNNATNLQAGHVGGQAYLYALLNCSGAESCSRLGASTDSGRTWRLADAPLMAAGAENVCAAAADQRGSALFAVTSSTTCGYNVQKPLVLWRSDDAGAHWFRQGTLTTPNVRGALITHVQGADRPLLYMGLPRTAEMATDKMGGQYPIFSADPSDLKASADGGKTWKSAPAAGIPAGLKPYYDMGLMGTLSDGSVVMDFIAQNREENFEGSTLFAWKPGDASWRQLAPPVTWEAGALLAIAGFGPGADTLYLTMVDRGGGSATAHPTFSFLRFEP
ncbi:MAG TPA: sialidase family protein [Ktedonobacterales bacterium]|jgi:hypothetical protein|nr:sialidase family protein [Ktedonobacterales bacterium]